MASAEAARVTERKLREWRADAVRWTHDIVWLRHPSGRIGPARLYPEQARALREATRRDDRGLPVYKTAAFSYPKRDSKSAIAALIGAHRTSLFEGQRSFVLANSRDQARGVVFDEIATIFRHSPGLKGLASIETTAIGVPDLDSTITCLPCNEQTVQGIAVTGVALIDELHAAPSEGPYNMLSGQAEGQTTLTTPSRNGRADVRIQERARLASVGLLRHP